MAPSPRDIGHYVLWYKGGIIQIWSNRINLPGKPYFPSSFSLMTQYSSV